MNSEQCASCGATARPDRSRTEFRIGNRTAVIEVERFRCEECGEGFYAPGQADAAFRRASDAIRQQENLLAAAEIRRIRLKFKLTQSQMEQLMDTGPKTFVRWEKGTIFQTKAADRLLRCLDNVPGVFEFLAAQSGVKLAEVADMQSSQSTKYQMPEFASNGITSIEEFKLARQSQSTVSVSDENEMPVIRDEAMK